MARTSSSDSRPAAATGPRAKATPRPRANSARGSRSARPIMALLDLLARRWAMRVLWELRDGRHSFRSLQEACGGVSPAVLNERLRELREGCLVELADGEGYGLTSMGQELLERFLPMVGWAERWAKALPK
jgi:DNA-binding HxlR family transcriptional regulator